MDKICLIYNPSGLGDVLFIQKICHHFHSLGFRVILPVVYEHAWLNNYIDNVDFISWQDKERKLTHRDKLPDNVVFPYKERYDPYAPCEFGKDFVYLNLYLPPNGPIMKYKYELANLEWRDWADFLIFKRNTEKENELFYDVLGLQDKDQYVFINRNYQMRPEVLFYPRISNNPDHYGGKKVVEMQILEGFTLFDWCRVVEMASEIHMVESSLNYVMESPEIRNNLTSDLNLYSRHNWFGEVDYLFKLPWKYHT